jgi:hypothetical protein
MYVSRLSRLRASEFFSGTCSVFSLFSLSTFRKRDLDEHSNLPLQIVLAKKSPEMSLELLVKAGYDIHLSGCHSPS